MTSTIGAPAIPDVRAVRPSRPPGPHPARAVSGAPPGTVVVRKLPPQGPVVVSPPPEPAATPVPVGASPRPPTSGMDLAGREVPAVLRLIMEMLDGRRPRSQLRGGLSKEVLRYLVAASGRLHPPVDRRAAALRGRHSPPGLRSVHLSHPAEGITEASAVWRHRGRFRALAARFEWTGTRWTCTALRLG